MSVLMNLELRLGNEGFTRKRLEEVDTGKLEIYGVI